MTIRGETTRESRLVEQALLLESNQTGADIFTTAVAERGMSRGRRRSDRRTTDGCYATAAPEHRSSLIAHVVVTARQCARFGRGV
jgi:hypothetical protein